MLERLTIRNFKRFAVADIELGKAVVLIGPNNSGKTTALQALALWDLGLRKWVAKREGKASPEKRPGVNINRKDLVSIPIPSASLLWRDLHVRNVKKGRGGQAEGTQNIRISIDVQGVTGKECWSCGLEFDYSTEESIVCRPLRKPGYEGVKVQEAKFTEIPEEATKAHVAYLPPMSGLAAGEPLLQPGRVSVLLGEGQTAQVLRNLCYQVHKNDEETWLSLARRTEALFGVRVLTPEYLPDRGEIAMEYVEKDVRLDLSSSGRGLQQTLLLLAHMYANPGSILLLDEPEAHMEILRQRQTYNLIREVADETHSQIIAASHSEVVLNEAAGRDVVVAFVGKPHRIDRGSQTAKALRDIGYDQYYQAEQVGWVLYVENVTDLLIMQAFAERLGHKAAAALERPFVRYVETNLPQRAREHFRGLQEAKDDLIGVAIFDRLDRPLYASGPLRETMWRRREIENYLCSEDTLLTYARSAGEQSVGSLFVESEVERQERAMREAIAEISEALRTLRNVSDPWSQDLKASDDLLDPLFRAYFKKLDLPILLRKSDYFQLARYIAPLQLDPEILEKLDLIAEVAAQARRPGD